MLDGFSLTASAGDLLAVAGPNGSGKTTLLYLLCGIYRASAGEVSYGGQPLSGFSREELAREVALMPQYLPYTPWLTVEELVELGLYSHYPPRISFSRFQSRGMREDAELAVTAAMEKAGVAHLAGRLSGELSGGELRRVHLARVLAQESRVFLLDEPAADLDLHHQGMLLAIARELAESGRTVIIVTHDLNFAALLGGKLLLMNAGREVALGEPREVLTHDALSKVYPGGFRMTQDADGMPLVFPAMGANNGGDSR